MTPPTRMSSWAKNVFGGISVYLEQYVPLFHALSIHGVDDRLALRKTVGSHAQQVIIRDIREIHLRTIEFGSYHWYCHILDPF